MYVRVLAKEKIIVLLTPGFVEPNIGRIDFLFYKISFI